MTGQYLSKRTGSLSVSEKIARDLEMPGIKLTLTSFRQNKSLRLMDIVIKCLTNKYDILHIDTFSGNAFIIADVSSFIGRLRRKKIIMTLHGGNLPDYFFSYPIRTKKVLDRADIIQTPSLYLREFFLKQEIDVDYLPNYIDLSKFKYSRNNVRSHSLLWVRAFSEIYNPRLAVRVLQEVKKIFPETVLTMIGPDKGLLREVSKLITELGLESSVTLTGPIPNDLLYKYYQTHAVFLNTTSYESFGIAVLEAAACGIPVVSTKVGEMPYMWKNGENILLVDDLDPSGFAVEVTKLFTSQTIVDRISTNARKRSEEYDLSLIREKWIQLFSSK